MKIERTPGQINLDTPETLAVVNSFTPLETQFMEAFIGLLYAEIDFSDVDVADVANKTGLTKASVKGVLGSLTKKGVVWTDANNGYDIIYLSRDYYFLHPEWRNDPLY